MNLALRRLPTPLLAAVLVAVVAVLAVPQSALAQANTCRWANDNECDEPRYNGTGACQNGTDANDCRAEAAAWQRLMGAVPANLRTQLGSDTCRWANDQECDDRAFGGTGACEAGTDATDCRAMAIGGDNSCRWANDNECDEPGIGTGACTSGTDLNDCRAVSFLRNRNNNCQTAFNDICDEPGNGTGQCRPNTDTADCVGRQRPPGAQDHFFGSDDRILVDVTQMPWRAIGALILEDGTCTATLIGPNLIATAAHCMQDANGQQLKTAEFRAGAQGNTELGRAFMVSAVVAPDYSPQSAPPNGGNGDDWAILTLDRDLGTEIGYIRPYVFDKADLTEIRTGRFLISQAGFSWDTGGNMSGHMNCQILTAYGDGSILHNCDTAQGDSGSPLMIERDGEWRLVAVESQFFDPQPPYPQMSSSYLSVDTRAFADALRRAGALD